MLVREVTNDFAGEIRGKIGTQGPPRSKPGNRPHKDSGDLQASTQAVDVTQDGGVIRGGTEATTNYAEYVDNSRPFLAIEAEPLEAEMARRFESIRAG